MNALSLRVASIGVAALLAPATPAQAQGAVPCTSASIEQLKAAYLVCDQVMTRQRVALPVAQRCSAVGNALQQCAFGGDFDQLIAWWRRERIAARAFDEALIEVERNTHSARRRHD